MSPVKKTCASGSLRLRPLVISAVEVSVICSPGKSLDALNPRCFTTQRTRATGRLGLGDVRCHIQKGNVTIRIVILKPSSSFIYHVRRLPFAMGPLYREFFESRSAHTCSLDGSLKHASSAASPTASCLSSILELYMANLPPWSRALIPPSPRSGVGIRKGKLSTVVFVALFCPTMAASSSGNSFVHMSSSTSPAVPPARHTGTPTPFVSCPLTRSSQRYSE